MSAAELVAALDSPNGWQRDMAMQMLVWRGARAAVPRLAKLATSSSVPEARLHALCILDALDGLRDDNVMAALKDAQAGVRRHAVRLAEKLASRSASSADALRKGVVERSKDDDAQVRLQTSCSLGAWSHDAAADCLARLAINHSSDPHVLGAVFSSLNERSLGNLAGMMWIDSRVKPKDLHTKIAGLAGAIGDGRTISNVMLFARWDELSEFLSALERRGESIEGLADADTVDRLNKKLMLARQIASNIRTPEWEGLDEAMIERLRLAAINVLARRRGDRDADREVLLPLLTPQSSSAIQAAAATALARVPGDDTARILLRGWTSFTPALRAHVLDLLLAREAWLRLLLTSIADGDVAAADIDLSRRQRLLTHKDAAIRTQAEKLFVGSINADRQQVLEAHRDALALPGDRDRGRAVFVKSCSVCHRLENTGHALGPDLAALVNKSPQFLLQEMLDPNRNVDSRYIAYTAATAAGRTFSGLLASETATSITLAAQESKQEVILRSDLEDLVSTRKSLMPEGLEKDLSRQQLADVIAYLTATRAAPKSLPGNSPSVIMPTNGTLVLSATTAEIFGEQIVFEEPFRNIGHWHGVGDHVAWTIELRAAAEFDAWLDWSCDNASAGNVFVLEGGEPALRGEVRRTGGWDRYRQEKLGTISLPAGTHRLSLRPEGEHLNGALMDLRGVYLLPKGRQLSITDLAK
jgi:putative heme-binding domain-containing protein